jgi:hypothetical protein
MRTSKADLPKQFDESRKRESILDILLIDLVRTPEGFKWFSAGQGESKVCWGVTRPTGAAGGYVITREGASGEHVRADYLEDAVKAAREGAHHASGYGDPETRQVYENRAMVAQYALAYRAVQLGKKGML